MMKLGLIGYPIGHSLSPWIHNQLLESQNLEGSYQLYEIEPDKFEENIKSLKKENLDGFNVTVPYKEQIIPFLDEMDQAAEFLGAVNTVKVEDGKWVGYNTDGIGYFSSVTSRFENTLKDTSKVLILGSGGAARGIYHAFLQKGVRQVDIANRTVQKAEQIIKELNGEEFSEPLTIQEAGDRISEYEVVIQTTSVGMSPNENQSIIDFDDIKENALFSDIVYRPMNTKFLKRADELGAFLHYGHEMLLHQAIYAFKIWTGREPEASELIEKFENVLKGE
ncbi:shikimate dehydrogenase [Halobacillus sp. A1]|uniref:shikimate dehydrogenase n=1 Tax=Halobacillus sp. A1 TaxID=2880262 RepID=UPI0020A61D9A|nr:shikimate dehydrogenase [Halobacillus sp. A1]MCP3030385.1 shikimate dehydrogenase [Halobacillus sp. A1]